MSELKEMFRPGCTATRTLRVARTWQSCSYMQVVVVYNGVERMRCFERQSTSVWLWLAVAGDHNHTYINVSPWREGEFRLNSIAGTKPPSFPTSVF
jgi:hypothetical protein